MELSMGEAEKVEEVLMPVDPAWGVINKEKAKPLFSIFKRCWLFLTLLNAAVPNSPQHVRKLLERPNEEKEGLVAAVAVLVLEIKMVKIEMPEEEKKRRKYWAEALIKLIALKGGNNI